VQSRFQNRVGWAKTYMKKAALLEDVGHRRFRITERGREVLAGNPPGISIEFLGRFPEFLEFKTRRQVPDAKAEPEVLTHTETPDEAIDAVFQDLRRKLAEDLLDRVKSCSPRFFEGLVVDLLLAMGYGGSRKDAGQAVGQTADGGIDGIIKEDRLGLDVVYIQAKRWEATVGRPVVQAFAGSLEGQRARKGVLITTSEFSRDAIEYVSRIEKKIVLIDGATLAQLMIDHGVGVSEVTNYVVKRVDLDYFSEEE
jgi:restriction system protein